MAETLSRTSAKNAETFEPVRAEVVTTPDDEQDPRFKGDLAGLMNEPNAEQGSESFDFNPREAFANLLRDAADRIAQVVETRGEQDEDGRAKVKRIGKGALIVGAQVGMVTAATTYLAAEAGAKAGGKVVTVIRQKIIQISVAAKERFKERALHKEAIARDKRFNKEEQDKAFDSYSENIAFTQAREAQDEAYDSYEHNVQYHQAHEEALEVNNQKKADQEAAYDSYGENIEATQKREAQEEAFESYEENISYSEALERKRAALARKEARKARRKEIYKGGREVLKKGAKGLGRIALKALKGTIKLAGRTTRAAVAGAKAAGSAAKESWKQG